MLLHYRTERVLIKALCSLEVEIKKKKNKMIQKVFFTITYSEFIKSEYQEDI
jgi:hypothetical protein